MKPSSLLNRRQILGAAVLAGGAALAVKTAFGAEPSEIHDPIEGNRNLTGSTTRPQPPGQPGTDYTPVFTPNGSMLPFKIVDGVKIMHLVAQEIQHEFAPGLVCTCWGYNGSTPGPTLEAVEGDQLRIYVTNRLPEPTTVHWHGLRIPNGMDGVNGLTQPPIAPGQTFKYEFIPPQAGTFMYHPHFDEMTQQSMGMMGMFIVHPRQKPAHPCDRDFVIMLSEWRIDPGTRRPITTEMTDFNILAMNSKVYPATQPLVASLGERVRIRFGNLSAMSHHPIHLHGFQMTVTETDGGQIQESARFAANTVLVPVGSTRAAEFFADNPGDWPMHCHMTHHTMNQMGHALPNFLGADTSAINNAVQSAAPNTMTMGQIGLGEMNEMRMPAPANSIPMLIGKGQFGAIDMGGMFTLVKVREGLKGFDDPGDYAFPAGSVASLATDAELERDGVKLP